MKKQVIAFLFLPALAWAHGEDKPGPHGGHIQMPGAFHTELMLDKDESVHIFLLDMNFKNPTTKDSEISVTAKDKKSEVKFDCSIMGGNHFHCIPQGSIAKKKEIIVKAIREKIVGNEAVYKLPLAPFKATAESPKQESHHEHH